MTRVPVSESKPTFRPAQWFGTADKNGFIYRNWMKNQGIPSHEFDGRPIIDIYNTWSELTPCNAHFRKLAEHAKRGICEAGGFPVEFLVLSNGGSNLRPTAMLTRNLAAMDVEGAIHGNPIDAVVLLAGCDKTTPALLMGATSCDVPTIVVTGGPIPDGKLDDKDIGSSAAVWQLHESLKAGKVGPHHLLSVEAGTSHSTGTYNTMGTVFIMAYMAETLGTSLPHNTAIPAVGAWRYVLTHMLDVRIVEMALQGLAPSKILTRAALENAIRVNIVIGGPTDAMIHLKATAGRISISLKLEDWSRIDRGTPIIVDLIPSGHFLMEELYYTGGLSAALHRLGEANLLPHPDTLTVNSKTLWGNVKSAPITDDKVIRPLDKPLIGDGGIRVLRGNLTPRGVVLKPSATSPELLRHHGRAIVFEDLEHYKGRVVDEALDMDTSSVLVMKDCGSKGYPGMAEAGDMGLPSKLLRQGVEDMVHIFDARMSDTTYETVVLHVTPETAAGGLLATMQDDDWIELDCEAGTLHLDIDDAELTRRMATYQALCSHDGDDDYQRLCVNHIL